MNSVQILLKAPNFIAPTTLKRMTLYDDTLALLQELIRNACVNDLTPDSGNEVRNADTLEKFFEGTDVEIARYESHPGRVSIVVTVPGDPEKELLTLMGHTDVVPVDEPKWTKPPSTPSSKTASSTAAVRWTCSLLLHPWRRSPARLPRRATQAAPWHSWAWPTKKPAAGSA